MSKPQYVVGLNDTLRACHMRSIIAYTTRLTQNIDSHYLDTSLSSHRSENNRNACTVKGKTKQM